MHSNLLHVKAKTICAFKTCLAKEWQHRWSSTVSTEILLQSQFQHTYINQTNHFKWLAKNLLAYSRKSQVHSLSASSKQRYLCLLILSINRVRLAISLLCMWQLGPEKTATSFLHSRQSALPMLQSCIIMLVSWITAPCCHIHNTGASCRWSEDTPMTWNRAYDWLLTQNQLSNSTTDHGARSFSQFHVCLRCQK